MSVFCGKQNDGFPKHFADVIKVKDLKIGRLAWITQVGLIQSHQCLKAEKLSPFPPAPEVGKQKEKFNHEGISIFCSWLWRWRDGGQEPRNAGSLS